MIPVDLRIRIDAEAVNVVIMKKKAEHCLIVESCQCSNNDKRGNVNTKPKNKSLCRRPNIL